MAERSRLRLKPLSLVAGVVLSALTLLAWTQTWFVVVLKAGATSESTISVTGGVAAPGIAAFSLAGLALVAALAIAGPVVRVILGVLQAAIGVGIATDSLIAMGAPIASSSAAITKVTGVTGADSVASLVASASQTAWPWIAVVLGGLITVLGVVVALTCRRWPGSPRRYQQVAGGEGENSGSAVSDWDSLSGGSDPTSR